MQSDPLPMPLLLSPLSPRLRIAIIGPQVVGIFKTKLSLMEATSVPATSWPLWRKILFRFFFVYLGLWISPWDWFDAIPGVEKVTMYWQQVLDWSVAIANSKLFHVRKVLVPIAGSGDTSYGWAMMDLFLVIATVSCVAWSIVDRKRKSYNNLNYWLCVFTRYYVAFTAFSYGIIKLFALQMPFPTLSSMATPLGDFFPMRFSWMFLGYSTTYQVFGGALEVLAGTLLLFRRTATAGTLVATGVFANVLMLNLAYDVPVKIFSAHLLLMCLFLLAHEYKRLLSFFILNRPTTPSLLYQWNYRGKWMSISRVVLKVLFIIVAVGWVFYDSYETYASYNVHAEPVPLKRGIYDVVTFAVNKDTIPQLASDTLRWRDFILDNAKRGSIKTKDTAFRQFYDRGYFGYASDTNKHIITLSKLDSPFVRFHYEIPDSNTVILYGKQRNDSLYVVLKRSNRHFRLAEKQFNWVTEYIK